MIIRQATPEDAPALAQMLREGHCQFGEIYRRHYPLDQQLADSQLGFALGADGAPASFLFVAEDAAGLHGVLELQTLAGYGINCLSYQIGQFLHRSDLLAICHAQPLLQLDYGLLGHDLLSLCVTSEASPDQALALIAAALAYRASHSTEFGERLYLPLKGPHGEAFWAATGQPLVAVGYAELQLAHAELLPQSPLLGCFLGSATQSLLTPPACALFQALAPLGFAPCDRLMPLDGGPVLQLG